MQDRMGTMSGRAEVAAEIYETQARADYGHLTLDELDEMPTLEQGQADDLKIATVDERVWLCRCGVEDGMPFDNAVTVEYLLKGSWVEVAMWEAS